MPAARNAGRSITIYVDSDEANLGQDDFPSVAEACCYGSTLTNAHFVISGHTDTVGSDTHNGGLA